MSSPQLTSELSSSHQVPSLDRASGGTSAGNVVRSEWIKLWTVRSTLWCLALSVVLGVGLVALVADLAASRYHRDPVVHLTWNPVTVSLRPLLIVHLVFAVFGVIAVTGEYSSGMIRTSLAAVPRRGVFMASKLAVFALVALVGGQVVAFGSFGVAQVLIHGQAPSASLGQHLVLRAVVGAGLYISLIGVLGLAFGFLLRAAAAGIGVMVAIMLVLPAILLALPTSWEQPIEEFWPTQAGQSVYALHPGPHQLSSWLGFGWMALFVLLVCLAAYATLARRDA